MGNIDFQDVTSSNIASIAWDKDSDTLYVGFHVKRGGQIVGTQYYQYDNVPESVYLAFMAAPSHGKYFHAHIKDKYPFTKW